MQNEQNLTEAVADQSGAEPKKSYLKQLEQYQTDEFAIKRAYQILQNEELTEEEKEEIIDFIMDRATPKCIKCGKKIQDSDIITINDDAYCPRCFGAIWERIKKNEKKMP